MNNNRQTYKTNGTMMDGLYTRSDKSGYVIFDK